MSLNIVHLIGHAGKQAEKPNENGPVRFSLATNNKYKNQAGEQVDETTWHNIVIWGKLGDVALKYVTKGKLLYLSGRISNRKYEKDGVTRYTSEIIVEKLKLLGSKSDSHSSATNEQPATYQNSDEINVEDIPF